MNNKSDKFLSFILSFAAGLMMAVVCFNLIPESLEISKISETNNIVIVENNLLNIMILWLI